MMAETSDDASSKKRQRLAAMVVLALGIIAALVVAFLYWRDQPEPGQPQAEIVQANGIFPVLSQFGIASTDAQPDVGHSAPNFIIHYPDGTRATLADFRGRPVLINFWATWCDPCRAEMPALVQAHDAHADEGLVILEINDAEAHDLVAQFVTEYGMTMPVVIDPQGAVMDSYKTNSLPSSFFIDRNGVIQVRWIGLMPGDMVEQQLRTIL